MCIALLIKPGIEVSEETLLTCYTNNSDGCGFAYVEEGQMKIFKSMDYAEFLEEFTSAKERVGASSPFLVHFRIATHGTVDEFNCHPFLVDDDTAFIHNGIIYDIRKDAVKSDTQVFNEDILQGLPTGWQFSLSLKPLIEKFIGFSKLVVLNTDLEWEIFNEAKGEWKDDIWFSNTSYKPRRVYQSSYGSGYGAGYGTGYSRNNTSHTTHKPATYGTAAGKGVEKKKEDAKRIAASSLADDALLDKKTSWVQCDNCGDFHKLSEMTAYLGMELDRVFCAECESTLLDAEVIDIREEFPIEEYIEDYNNLIKGQTAGGTC